MRGNRCDVRGMRANCSIVSVRAECLSKMVGQMCTQFREAVRGYYHEEHQSVLVISMKRLIM